MSLVAVVRLPAEEFALSRTLTALPDAEFECERVVETGDGVVMPLLWARGADREELESAFDDDPTVDNWELLVDLDGRWLYQMDWIDDVQMLFYMLTNTGGTVLDMHGVSDEWMLRILFPDDGDLGDTRQFCDQRNLTFDVVTTREMEGEPSGRFGLTAGQIQALRAACTAGYFEIPRRATLEEVAEDLDISHQALSERLRRGHNALIQDTVLTGPLPEK
ncbi:helix-turn-helix domain-containing protein [Candidatus Halobonum tyrrellensis]|uniref:DNA binding domain-containing protein n=1 Tax=Candidatus Halobonum tyrrellensis G22 TaxID=1324957 RepID=V4HHJ9_9EURY|nr:helix-turn-helix domain-containing protein [Candidatus Halobonum tyrrellensis]ESP87334.1 DNA binding domain-containing protein [Candidatus Halobonum tyrrellensis G22]